jgi:hypothetical protein
MANINQLNGVFSPIYACDVLQTFFSYTDKFGTIEPIDESICYNNIPKLMDFLPCVRRGFILRNTLTMLFFLYVRRNKLQIPENMTYSRFDNIMEEVFCNMNAEYYKDDNLNNKILMSQAIEMGIIDKAMSTQEVIRMRYPEFNQDNTEISNKKLNITIYEKAYKNYYFQLFATYNYHSINNLTILGLTDILDIINDDVIRDQMIKEHDMVKEICDKLNKLCKDGIY